MSLIQHRLHKKNYTDTGTANYDLKHVILDTISRGLLGKLRNARKTFFSIRDLCAEFHSRFAGKMDSDRLQQLQNYLDLYHKHKLVRLKALAKIHSKAKLTFTEKLQWGLKILLF